MAKLTADSFLNVLQQSDLIDKERIRSLMGEMQAAGVDVQNSSAIGEWLIEQGHLTAWQVGKLQQGRHKGFRLGKYRLRELLGKGGMSSVYLAEHTLMRRRCAIKVLPIKKVKDSSYLARFHREAQAVAALDHPNIVRAYDIDHEVDKNQEIHFLVMEYVKGRSLHEIVTDDGPLTFEDAAEFGRQSALGLNHAHEAGLVHRDVKPGNLLFDEGGTVKVLDLGLARFSEAAGDGEPLTVAHDEKVLGTADYLSPEQALDSHLVDNRADIYSLGCSMYFALTGQPPFNEGSIAQRLMWHQVKEPPEMSETRADIPESLAAIVRRMMSKKTDDRYPTMAEVSTALLDWLGQNASAEWKQGHPDVLSGAPAPAALPVAPVAVPVQPGAAPVAAPIAPAPVAAPIVTAEAPAPAAGTPVDAFPGLPSSTGDTSASGEVEETVVEVPAVTNAELMDRGEPDDGVPELEVDDDEVGIEFTSDPSYASAEVTRLEAVSPVVGDLEPADDETETDHPAVTRIESAAEVPAVEAGAVAPTDADASGGVFPGLPGGAMFDESPASVPEDVTPAVGVPLEPDSPGQEAPAAVPLAEAVPVAAAPLATPPVSAEAPVEAEPVFPGPPPEATPADVAPPDFLAAPVEAPVADSAPLPDFSAPQEAAIPAAPVEPAPAAAPVLEAVPQPPAAQPVFDPTAVAPAAAPVFDPRPAAGAAPSAVAPVRQQKKKSGAPVGLIVGILVAVAALGGGGFYLFGGGGDDDGSGEGGSQTSGGGDGETDESSAGGGGTSGASSTFYGFDLTVGPDGNFKTIAALLQNLSEHKLDYPQSRRQTIKVTVAAGKYPEAIVIDNTNEQYPNGIQMVAEAGSPAILAPSGNGPVVKLTELENFRLEGFEIDASGRDNAIELAGYLDRSTLKNVTVSGYSKAGIRSDGAVGTVDEEFVIEDVRFQPTGGNSVGIVFAGREASRTRIVNCRFFGPQNSAVVFETGAGNVTVRDSIIEQAGIGITLAGVNANWRNVAIFNNTFYDCSKAGLHFSSAPSDQSFEIAIHRNVFSKLGGAEMIVEQGYDLKKFQQFASSGKGGFQFNWSDRKAAANQTTGWEVVLRPELRLSEIPFASTDRSSPDFLRPTTQFAGFRPGGGSQRYPGAVKPK